MSIRQGAMHLTLSYMLMAGLWVLLSDRLLSILDLPLEQFEHLQSLKGLGLVLLSDTSLYLILWHHQSSQASIRKALSDSDAAEITRAVIAPGHSLNLKMLAEGIEEPGQLAFLRERGCNFGQCYYFGRPQPAMDSASHPHPEPSFSRT